MQRVSPLVAVRLFVGKRDLQHLLALADISAGRQSMRVTRRADAASRQGAPVHTKTKQNSTSAALFLNAGGQKTWARARGHHADLLQRLELLRIVSRRQELAPHVPRRLLAWVPEFGGRTWVLDVRDWPSQNGVFDSHGK